ncbi:MAG: hypothetical protein FWE09_01120 [Treponema sp.]|nr:hypothetical protein [Treponema sp.]
MTRAAALAALLFAALCGHARAQDAPQNAPPTPWTTIPREVFVGDRALLIVPLSQAVAERLAAQGSAELPFSQAISFPDIDIYRVALERRPGGPALAIEFAAFLPGIVALPPLEVAGEVFYGLAVEIASVLRPSEPRALSPPAGSLSVPGTALLAYGALAALAAFLAILALARGASPFRRFFERIRRRRMFARMIRSERRLRKALSKGAAARGVLDALCGDFRGFLSGITGENCRAMSAPEMRSLILWDAPSGEREIGLNIEDFFARCDGARFAGRDIAPEEALEMLEELRLVIQALEQAEKARAVASGASAPTGTSAPDATSAA